MAAFAIDASFAAAWCFPDERTDYTEAALTAVTSSSADAVAPALWAYEVRNTTLMGLRRKRISEPDAELFLASLNDLNVKLLDPLSYSDLFALARLRGLTVYDAAHLSLALRSNLPLATLDRDLIRAANEAEHPIFVP